MSDQEDAPLPEVAHKVMVMTKGHPFERDPFANIFDSLAGLDWTHVEHPAAQVFYNPELAKDYEAFVLYDMPGIFFNPEGGLPNRPEPSAELKAHFEALTQAGHPILALHHAIAGWPAWPEYGDALGGHFYYCPTETKTGPVPGGGYHHDVDYNVEVLADHPITQGVDPSFPMCDEVYMYHVNENDVVPLLKSDHEYLDKNFYAAELAINGQMFSSEGWSHPPTSNLVGWITSYNNSPIVYFQFGDAPNSYANQNFRRLVGNAINWLTTDDARNFAKNR